jgi:hypothetical protein
MAQRSDHNGGLIHRRLMRNVCPACMHQLSIQEKTDSILVRKCPACKLTISDNIDFAEIPDNICD